jgi:hypothetical protein
MATEIIKQLHEETIRLLEKIKDSKDDHFKIFNELEEFRLSRFKVFEERIPGCKHNIYLPTNQLIEEAQEEMYQRSIIHSKKNPELVKPLRDFFLSPFNKYRERFDLIAAFGDSESTQMVFDIIEEQFKKDVDDDIDKSSFYGLLELAKIPQHRERVTTIIRTGFDKCIKAADGELVNDTIFNLLGQLAVLLNVKEAASEISKAFIFAGAEEQNYEMNTVASRLVLYLTALGNEGPVDEIKKYIDYYNDSYEDEEFVVRARYASWWFEKDTQEALGFLADRERKKSLGIVAAFLADMNEEKALPILETRINELKNQVAIEAFKEAISRLKSPQQRSSSERMIWMFGYVTPTEQVLGEETDNEFAHRANIVSSSAQRIIYEADESTSED